MSKFLATFAVSLFLAASFFAQTQTAPLMIGRVAVNQTHVAFTYAGKIWLVERAGGAARKLNDTAHEEGYPIFSPDGKTIAFSRLNGSDWGVYAMNTNGGGEAKQLTFQGENDFAVNWTPDGQAVIFESTRDEENVIRLYKIAVNGAALYEPLPLPQATYGSFSPDGKFIAYNPHSNFGEWRYYRGGVAAPLWIADLQTGALEKLPSQSFNERFPMWLGDRLYFVSDRTDGVFNLFVQDRRTKQIKQLTNFDRQGIRAAAATDDAIVFAQNGRLHLFDLAKNQAKEISVSVAPDTSELRPRTVGAMRALDFVLPSANGDRLTVGARGEVLLFDASSNSAKNLTNTSGVAERFPTLAPDGKSVAYFSDEAGEYALHVRSLETDAVKKISIEKQGSFYWEVAWSPDSKKIVFADRRLNLWLADVETGAASKIDASSYSAQDAWRPAWSPDSRFLAYAKRLKNRAGTIFIHDLAAKRSVQITDGLTHTESPIFDRNGKYLYFISSPNALTSEFEWGVLNGVVARPLVARRIHALILDKVAQPPFLPNGQPNPDAKTDEAAAQTAIDFQNLATRFVDLPLPARDYTRLAPGQPGKLFIGFNRPNETPGAFSGAQNQKILLLDFAKSNKPETIIEETSEFDVTFDGKRILFDRGRDWFLTNAEVAPKADEGKLDLSKMEIRVEPQAEWRQMFRESMRIMRDWFYDPNYHGQNLAALEQEFAAYLPTVTRRADLNRLMAAMLGSVSVSHLGVGGGDAPPPAGTPARTGLLGADYAVENGRVRFKKIYRATSFASANGSFSAPLDAPGVDVRAGDYLLEVNGNKVGADKNLFSLFENTAGKPTKITVSADADGSSSRTFTVFPAAGENRLRRANWAENNRRRVEQLSGGKLGYVFIENYDADGISNAIRGLAGFADKAGVVVDQRYNGGGITPDYLIEWMARKPLYYYAFRGGDDIATPVNPAPPVKVLLINEWNGSAAETGAFMFRLGKVGKLVGKRTFGGGIGPYFYTPRLIDGGRIQLPNRAAYAMDGSSWGIENIGVTPDVEVDQTPQDLLAGRDAQLEKAVEVALAEIAKTKLSAPRRPAFPVHPTAKQNPIGGVFNLPLPGSAFPIVEAKTETKTIAAETAQTNGKFAAFVGSYDSPMGALVIRQEGDKLFGDAGGERVEFVPEAQADKFTAQPVGANVSFVRDASGKVTEVVVIMSGGREIRGKKSN